MAVEAAENPDNLAENWSALTSEQQDEVRKSMEHMGISARRARQILKAYGGGRYLRRGIGPALALTFEFSSLEQADRALQWLGHSSKNTKLPMSERIDLVKAMGPVMENIRKMSESFLTISEKFSLNQRTPPPLPPAQTQTVQLGVSINNFPPVAKMPARGRNSMLENAGDDNR